MEIEQGEIFESKKNKTENMDNGNQLFRANRGKNLIEVKKIITHGENSGNNPTSIIIKTEEKSNEENLLLLAMLKGNDEIIEFLLKKGQFMENVNSQDINMHEAIKNNSNVYLVQKLISYGISLEMVCSNKVPPLFQLVAEENLELIELFFENGASFAEKTNNGEFLLHFALSKKYKNKKLIRLLLRCGASLSVRNHMDLTPLHYLITQPVETATREKIKLLLEYGSDVNTWSKKKKETVLHTAVKYGNSDAVELLLLHGADINTKDWKDYTAFKRCFELRNVINRSSKMISYFLREIIKLKVFNKYIDQQILNLLMGAYFFYALNFFETDVLLNTNIIRNVNLLHILAANDTEITAYIKNPTILKYLESPKINVFINWVKAFKFQLKKGKERRILLYKCEEPLKKALKWQAPNLVVVQILSYLSRTDLRCLYAACDPKIFMKSNYL